MLWQATSIITPLLARLGGAKLAREIWLGCFLALCGAALIACDQPASSGNLSAAASGLSAGDTIAWVSMYTSNTCALADTCRLYAQMSFAHPLVVTDILGNSQSRHMSIGLVQASLVWDRCRIYCMVLVIAVQHWNLMPPVALPGLCMMSPVSLFSPCGIQNELAGSRAKRGAACPACS